MKNTKNSTNLYFVLVLIAIILLGIVLIDGGIGCLQSKLERNNLEKFSNLNPAVSGPVVSIPEEKTENINKKNKIEDNSFMYEIENKELSISDFYPTEKVYSAKTKDEMLKFTLELDLFHQIIPKFKSGYLGIVWFDSRIAGIYETDSLTTKKWTRIEKDIPAEMVRPVFISYDKDRMLLGIFEDKDGKNHLYKKECTSLDKDWLFVEQTKMVSFIYDPEEIMIGLDNKGRYYRKTNSLLESEWEALSVNFEHIPMRKLLYDYQTDIMLGVGQDFRIYKKRYRNWLKSDWAEPTKKSLSGSVRDIFYDYDGHIVGLSRVGIVKKKDLYYLTDFKLYSTPLEKKVSIYKLLYSITGIKSMAQYEDSNNNNNNVYVDGKKISEYKFKDPRLNKFLDYRMNLKKQCRKLKGMKIIKDNKKELEEEQIRNQRFGRILDEQKNTIDSLMDTIQGLKDSSF